MLFDARVALQRVAGQTDRLLLEHQDRVADALGLADADELMTRREHRGPHDRDANRTTRGGRCGRRCRAPAAARPGRDQPLSPGVVLRDGEVALLADADPAADPSLVLRAAADAAYLGVADRAADAAALRRGGSASVPEPWTDRHARRVRRRCSAAATPMVPHGRDARPARPVRAATCPSGTRVRSKPQRNAFHRFTVDRHLLEAVAQRRASSCGRSRRPDLLLVGALLHDLGKGWPRRPHRQRRGARRRPSPRRMGFDAADVARARRPRAPPPAPARAVATGRDLDDPATIATVADAVGTEDTLDLLAALTEADSLATGPAALERLEGGLLERLVDRVRARAATARGASR